MSSDRYAWEEPGVFEVAPGVHRIPLPLPGDGLRAVNVYALTSTEGLVLIDAGWALDQARARLETALAELGHDLGTVACVFATHVHRDHYELGVELRRLFGTRVALGVGERLGLQDTIDRAEAIHTPMMDRLARAGAHDLVEVLAEKRRQQFEAGELPRATWELPDQWLQDAQVVELDGRRLTVVATPGHTQGHVVFVDDDAGLLFAGDHVLPHITPSIGVERLPTRRALVDYLASLALVRGLPDQRLLPAHGPVLARTHPRIDELLAHHDDRLATMRDAVAGGAATAYEVARAVPWTRRGTDYRDLDVFNQMLAVNESAAHLEVLVRQGELAVRDHEEAHGPVHHHALT